MGLLRFVKSAGAKIFGATETAAAPKHGLDVAQVEVKSKGDKVVLSGSDASTEEAEKIAPATDDLVGVATVQDDIVSAAEAAESKFYTVPPDDTPWKIAGAENGHGHDGEYHRIFEANKTLLSDPDKIYPGQCRGFLPSRTESLRMNRREDIFDSCALAGWACPANVESHCLSLCFVF